MNASSDLNKESKQDRLATRREQYAKSKRKLRAKHQLRNVSVSLSPIAYQRLSKFARTNALTYVEVIEKLLEGLSSASTSATPNSPSRAVGAVGSDDDSGKDPLDGPRRVGHDWTIDAIRYSNAILGLVQEDKLKALLSFAKDRWDLSRFPDSSSDADDTDDFDDSDDTDDSDDSSDEDPSDHARCLGHDWTIDAIKDGNAVLGLVQEDKLEALLSFAEDRWDLSPDP